MLHSQKTRLCTGCKTYIMKNKSHNLGMEQKLPPGFADILRIITKEVIMHKPLNIYQLCAKITEHELDKQILNELAIPVKINLEDSSFDEDMPVEEPLIIKVQKESAETNLTVIESGLESVNCEPTRACYMSEERLMMTPALEPEDMNVGQVCVEEDIIKCHVNTITYPGYDVMRKPRTVTSVMENKHSVAVTPQEVEGGFTEDSQQSDTYSWEPSSDESSACLNLATVNSDTDDIVASQKNLNIRETSTGKILTEEDCMSEKDVGQKCTDLTKSQLFTKQISDLDPIVLHDHCEANMIGDTETSERKMSLTFFFQKGACYTQNTTDSQITEKTNAERSIPNDTQNHKSLSSVIVFTQQGQNCTRNTIDEALLGSDTLSELKFRHQPSDLNKWEQGIPEGNAFEDEKAVSADMERYPQNDGREPYPATSTMSNARGDIMIIQNTMEDSLSANEGTSDETDLNSWESYFGEESTLSDEIEQAAKLRAASEIGKGLTSRENINEDFCQSEDFHQQKQIEQNSWEPYCDEEGLPDAVKEEAVDQHSVADDPQDRTHSESNKENENNCISEGNFGQKQTNFNTPTVNIDIEGRTANDMTVHHMTLFGLNDSRHCQSSNQNAADDSLSEGDHVSDSSIRQAESDLSNSESCVTQIYANLDEDKMNAAEGQLPNDETKHVSNQSTLNGSCQQPKSYLDSVAKNTFSETDFLRTVRSEQDVDNSSVQNKHTENASTISIATHCSGDGYTTTKAGNNSLLQKSIDVACITKNGDGTHVFMQDTYHRPATLYEEIIQYIEYIITAAIEYIISEGKLAAEKEEQSEEIVN